MKKLLCLLFSAAILAALGAGALVGWAHWKEKPPLLENVPWSTAVYDRDGTLLHLTLSEDEAYRLPVGFADISPEAVSAALRYEDRFFYEHPGVNPFSLVRAAFATWTGPRSIGASTITMQVARRLQGLETRTIRGKIEQILWALRYDAHYSKEEILAAYFSLAPYGGNVEGIEAASLRYFGKRARQLGTAESIALSVVPQNPVKRLPGSGEAFEKARQRAGEAALAGGFVSERLAPAVRGPLQIRPLSALPFEAPHFTRLVEKNAAVPRLYTTLSLPLQHALEGLLRDTAARLSDYGITNGALTVVDTRTMDVLAHVGSADFFSDAIEGEVDGVTALRSPGSTLKPFIYGMALDQGLIHSRSILIDSPKNFRGYAPDNSDGRFRGPLDATEALVTSRNVPAVTLAQQLRPDLHDFLKAAGLPLAHPREHYGLSIVLGGAEVSMTSLAEMYAMLASGGILRPVKRLADEKPDRPSQALLSPEAAWIVREMLLAGGETVTVAGTKIPLIWKTGTSNGYRDAWTAGLAGHYAVVVWLGNFSGRPGAYLQGAAVALPLFRSAAMRVLTDPLLKMTEADRAALVARPEKVIDETVCRNTGDLATDTAGRVRCTDTVPALFIPGKSPIRDTGVLREILIDKATGLRACEDNPDTVERRFWEFWPTQYQETFLAAGIVKRPPPAWMPGCKAPAVPEGRAPSIVSPRSGATYFTGTAGRTRANVILRAGTDPDAKLVYWFADSEFLGAVKTGAPFVWKAAPGRYRIEAVDDRGRSAARTLRVRQP